MRDDNHVFVKAKEVRDEWLREVVREGAPFMDAPTPVGLYKAIRAEIEADMDRMITNVLSGKETRINGTKLLAKVKHRYIREGERV